MSQIDDLANEEVFFTIRNVPIRKLQTSKMTPPNNIQENFFSCISLIHLYNLNGFCEMDFNPTIITYEQKWLERIENPPSVVSVYLASGHSLKSFCYAVSWLSDVLVYHYTFFFKKWHLQNLKK